MEIRIFILLSREAEGIGPVMPGNQRVKTLAKVLLPTDLCEQSER